MSLKERVQLGVELLDEKKPNWRKEINLDLFNIRECNQCILGQLFGGFSGGLSILDIYTSADYGFDLTDQETWGSICEANWNELAGLWRKEILGI